MRKLMAVLTAVVSCNVAFALAPEKNDFWDTTGYAGDAPVVAESAPLATVFESWLTFLVPTLPFTGELPIPPSGMLLIFR